MWYLLLPFESRQEWTCDCVCEVIRCRICTVSFSLYDLEILLPFLLRWQLESKAAGISRCSRPQPHYRTASTRSAEEPLCLNPPAPAHRWGGPSHNVPQPSLPRVILLVAQKHRGSKRTEKGGWRWFSVLNHPIKSNLNYVFSVQDQRELWWVNKHGQIPWEKWLHVAPSLQMALFGNLHISRYNERHLHSAALGDEAY